MKLSIAQFHPAHQSNYSKGRGGYSIDRFTVHHSAGWEQTLRYLWADPARNGSSHFWVGNKKGAIEQYVDTDDMAWTNTNSVSNKKALTCETRGDWRNGYYDQTTIDNLETLMAECRKRWPSMILTYHMDESNTITLCPADLKHKGWAHKAWQDAGYKPAPKPPTSKITYKKITPKRIKLTKDADLWNFNFTNWSKAKSVKKYEKGTVIDVVAIATNALGGEYYMTAYSYNNSAVRATNGFNIADCEDYKPAITEPPTVQLKWEAMTTPRKLLAAQDLYVKDLENGEKNVGDLIKEGTEIDFVEKTSTKTGMYLRTKWSKQNSKNWGIRMDELEEIKDIPREPVPEPPIDINPDVPGEGDVIDRLNALEAIVKKIMDFLSSIFSGFNK